MADKRRAQLAGLLAQAKAKDGELKAIMDKADKEGREDTPDELKAMATIGQETQDLLNRAEELKAVLDLRDGASAREAGTETGGNLAGHSDGQPAMRTIKSLGEMFTENEDIQKWLKALGPSHAKQLVTSPRVEVESFFNLSQNMLRTLLTSGNHGTSAGPLLVPQQTGIVDQFYQRPLVVRDLITAGMTSTDAVEYVRITGITNNAGFTAEAQNTTFGNSSGRKPESAIEFERVSETVKTLAHWIPATNRAIQDAGQLRTYIDNMLRYGIDEELEDQIINGDGTGENFLGILNTPGLSTQGFDVDILRTTRKARTKIRVDGRAVPSAFLLHPNDWEAIDLLKDEMGRYYFGGPLAMGQKTLWGLPVIESEAIPEGTGLCADFKLAILWDRMQSAIAVSNSHNDFFVRNLIAVLAEMRAAFGVIRSKAFCEIETQPAS